MVRNGGGIDGRDSEERCKRGTGWRGGRENCDWAVK